MLGPAKVTVIAIDSCGFANAATNGIDISGSGSGTIELLTLGPGWACEWGQPRARASGRIDNVNLDDSKVVVYIYKTLITSFNRGRT